jgi:tetratricopeptide (TPR) repeat protein
LLLVLTQSLLLSTGLLLLPVTGFPAAERSPDPIVPLDRAMAAAETGLRDGDRLIAESHYRSALLEGWLLMGDLQAGAGRLPEARDAFGRAATAAVETKRALVSLATVHMQMGEATKAVAILIPVVGRDPKDVATRRLLAQALYAAGQAAEAVQELEEARAKAPDDAELAFALASGYLKVKRAEAAERLFAEVSTARPIPQTHVLIGRTYRDFKEFDRAQAELRLALKLDPRVRRAHYYLGTVAIMSEGPARLDEAIAEFQQELKLYPGDPLVSLRLGIALMEARRPEEALPVLEIAVGSEPPQADAFHYLGRAQLALDRPKDAAVALGRALELLAGPGQKDEVQLGSIHYNLALALRNIGATEEATAHFAEAELASGRSAESSRERLSRYMRDTPDPEIADLATPMDMPLAGLDPKDRLALTGRVVTTLARAYLNLGIIQAQSQRFARAAELFEQAAEVEPEFPHLQYSLGVARFNAQQFDKATEPLARALSASPDDVALRHMLALAWLNTEAYGKAVDLLRNDASRDQDPALQYAYGLALVRSRQAAEAQVVFSRLLAEHGDSAELQVVIGQAHAEQEEFEAAIESLQRALRLKADVAEANATLGVIYLKQGRLPEAEVALRSELKSHPADLRSLHNLALLLDLLGRPQEALPLLRTELKSRPQFADARYLLGKVLLGQGATLEAAEQLEAAARIAPEDANVRYQLGQAYQKLGRTEMAQEQFEVFQKLKDKRRERTP